MSIKYWNLKMAAWIVVLWSDVRRRYMWYTVNLMGGRWYTLIVDCWEMFSSE
jgi:hypothetical protein